MQNKISDFIPEYTFQVGDCLIISGDGFISDGIEWVTGGIVSHVAIYVGGGDNGIIEAREHGVERNTVDRLFKDVNRFVCRRIIGLTVEQSEIMKTKAYSLIKKNYDYRFFFSLGLFYMLKKLGITWFSLLGENKNELICNELYRLCALEAGISFTQRVYAETPDTYLTSALMNTVLDIKI